MTKCFHRIFGFIVHQISSIRNTDRSGRIAQLNVTREDVFQNSLFQYPEVDGQVKRYEALTAFCNEHKVFVVAAADLLSLIPLTPPGEMGADVEVGTTQRFGVPMGYGGPHAAYFATKEALNGKYQVEIIGVTQDKENNQLPYGPSDQRTAYSS